MALFGFLWAACATSDIEKGHGTVQVFVAQHAGSSTNGKSDSRWCLRVHWCFLGAAPGWLNKMTISPKRLGNSRIGRKNRQISSAEGWFGQSRRFTFTYRGQASSESSGAMVVRNHICRVRQAMIFDGLTGFQWTKTRAEGWSFQSTCVVMWY